MRAIFYMAQKDLRLLLRDWPGLFWLLAFPLIMALFFGSIFIGMGDEAERAKIEVAFVDNTGGMPYAADFKAELDSLGPITVWPTTLDSAKMMVRLGRRQAYLMLSPDTTAREGFSMYPGGVPELAVGIDPSRQAESGILRGLLTQVHFKLVMAQFTDPGRARSMISESMAELDTLSGLKPDQKQALTDMFSGLNSFFDQAEKDTAFALEGMGGEAGLLAGPNITIDEVTRERTGPRSSFDVTFPQALMWGLIGCVAAFSMSIVTERTRGTFHRLRLAPVSRGQIIGGKALACLVASIGVCVLLMAAGVGIFGVSLDEPLKLALAIAASAVCFVGLMMLISVLGKSEQAVSGAGWAIMLIFSMTGGGMIPLVAMPGWFLSLSKISPVRWGIISLEGAIWRGYSYAEMMPAVTILLVVGIVGYAIGVWILTKSDH